MWNKGRSGPVPERAGGAKGDSNAHYGNQEVNVPFIFGKNLTVR